MKLTHEWQKYDHDYTKDMHDIRTIDGNEYYQCWPNAGKFNVISGNDCGKSIPDSEVTHVKMSDNWMTEEEELQTQSKPRGIVIGAGSNPLQREILHTQHQKMNVIIPGIDEDDFFDYENRTPWINKLATSITKTQKPNKGLKLGSYNSKRNK